MQETGGFLSGDWNYMNLRGDTGPCVYPAGFLYIFSVLRMITNDGKDILLGQYIFAGIYCILICVLLAIYRRVMLDNNAMDKKNYLPIIWVILLLCASRRIHSIFVLRLFNDGIAMLFLYLAILAWLYDFWSIGSIMFR
jgi:alpha-1,3-mannosyltransferase